MDPRVTKMIEKIQYQPRFGLKKNQQGIPKLPYVKTQKGTKGLGYTERDFNSKKAKKGSKNKGKTPQKVQPLEESFIKEGRANSIWVQQNLSV